MNRFKGKIIESLFVNEKEFIKVIDEEEGNEYKLPKSQILFPVREGRKYDFFVEYNEKFQKEFISIMHPDFLVGDEADYEIESISDDEFNRYFILKSDFKIPIKVPKLKHQNEKKRKVRCRILRYKMGEPILRNIDFQNDNFRINEKYKFNIVEFSHFFDRKGNKVYALVINSELLNDSLSVRSYDWHKEGIWQFKDIECEVIGFDTNSDPKLKIIDSRHPYYSIGNKSKFKVEEIVKRTNFNTGRPYFVLAVCDEFDFRYEVSALPNQERRVQVGDEIECEVKGIDTKVRLGQVNIEDPFFYRFEEIVDDVYFKKNYFSRFFDDNHIQDEYIEQFKTQYKSSQGFWVFTYCNHILPTDFRESISKKNYAKAHEINNLLILFENWILTHGILRAIHGEEERKMIKKRVNYVLNNCNAKSRVLSHIVETRYDEFLTLQKDSVSYQELFYFLSFSDIKLIDGRKFISIIKKKSERCEDEYFFEQIGDVIEIKKQFFLNQTNDNYFVLLNSNEKTKEHIDQLKLWTYCQHLLYNKANIKNKSYLALAKLIRYSLNPSQEKSMKVKIMSNAYNILVEKIGDKELNFDHNYNIDTNNLEENPNIKKSNIDTWSKIEETEKEQRHLTLRVVEPYYKGFKVEYNGIYGFLPYQNITCLNLKKYNQRVIDWEINAKVIISGKVFGLFTVKQLDIEDPYFLSKNLNYDKLPQIGTIITGRVKQIVDYGIFISSEYGDGLLRLNNLDDEFGDKRGSLKYFEEGEEIFVKLIDVTKDRKMEFGFKQLIGTAYEYHYNKKIFGSLDDLTEPKSSDIDIIKKKYEEEKGNIIEQFAAITHNLEDKIKYIKLSKYFFSNTNNAKSYLHNIYIEYFQRLKELDSVIENYSISNYNQFRHKIQEIGIQPMTLEGFPESENLIVFIEILGLFNNTDIKSNKLLFDLVQKYSNNDEKKLLSVLSKATFANNLMISEVIGESENEKDEFSLKNLKVIRNYIENGVFSLAESKEDKLTRELEEKRTYWMGKINQDEGEKLEFKSTLITPVPDEQKNKILDSLNEKLLSTGDEKARKGILNKIDEIKGDNAQKRIIHSAFKTIAAFANTNGGTLLLGVSDDKNIYGLEKDFDSFKDISEKNRDGFGKFLDSKLKSYFGDGFSSQYLEKEFLKFPEGDILIIKVKESAEEVFLLRDDNDNPCPGILYVRNLSSTDKLEGIELSKFIKNRTSKRIYSKIENEAEQRL